MAGSDGFHSRAFFSFIAFFGFICAALTGAVLYMAPEGGVAFWTGWMFLGLTKKAWGNVHIVSSLLFLLGVVFHIFDNNGGLVGYMKGRMRGKRELAAGGVLVLLAAAGAILEFPPVDTLIVFNARVKDSWIKGRDFEPPFWNAEQMSLRVFAQRQSIDLDDALKELDSNNIQVKDPDDSLQDIAADNSIVPVDIYRAIRPLEALQQDSTGPAFTPEASVHSYAGSAIGTKTLDEICQETGTDPVIARERLSSRGIEMRRDETIKQVSDRYHLLTLDLLKIILIEQPEG